MTRATGKYELSFENPYELLRTYINWFAMSTKTKRGSSRFEPPHNRRFFQNVVVCFLAGKLHEHPRRHYKET